METENVKLTKDEEFIKAATALIEYLKKNHHPHVSCIVTYAGAELLEGLKYHSSIEEPIKELNIY